MPRLAQLFGHFLLKTSPAVAFEGITKKRDIRKIQVRDLIDGVLLELRGRARYPCRIAFRWSLCSKLK